MSSMRSHGEGSIFQRKSGKGKGRWVALVSMRDGRRVSRWAKTRDEAKAELAELLRLRDAGAPITGKIRLGQYLERWVANDHDLAPATARKHESAIRVHLIPELGHIRLSELRPEDVSLALRRRRRDGLGDQSVRHLRATLRRCLADAVRDGLVSRNAAALSQPPPLKARERTILDANQARILIESTRGTRYGPLWTILVTTGLRISEALGLRWSDVDFGGGNVGDRLDDGLARTRTAGALHSGDRRQGLPAARAGTRHLEPAQLRPEAGPSITVRHQLARENGEWVRRAPKTAKGRRTIPLTPLGVEALRAQRAMQREWRFGDGAADGSGAVGGQTVLADVRGRSVEGDPGADSGAQRDGGRHQGVEHPTPIDGLVFTTSTGHPLHGTNVVKRLADDLAAAGLPHVTCHSLRHSCATILIANGYPIEKVAKILGHTTPRITAEIYMHLTDRDTADSADVLERALG